MRSRYSAYVLGLEEHLHATWHASTRPAEVLVGNEGVRWLGLTVKHHVQQGDDHATVEFIARYRRDGATAVRLHEISRFIRADDRWWYVDGAFPSA